MSPVKPSRTGLQPLAGTGSIWIVPRAAWQESEPEIRSAYTCGGQPVIVEYPVGRGHAVWWASSMPLENGSIVREQNYGAAVQFDRANPGPPHLLGRVIAWAGAYPMGLRERTGLAVALLWCARPCAARRMEFQQAKRAGACAAACSRTTPIEFLDALGGLYRSTGAAATAMQIAWERFRSQAALLTGQRHSQYDAREFAAAIECRFGSVAWEMGDDLIAAEEASWDEALKPGRALILIQSLRRHEETLRTAGIMSTLAPRHMPKLDS